MDVCMQDRLFDSSAPKKATNLSVNSDLLRQARVLNINLSQLLESRLIEIVRESRRKQWLEDNREALQEYNDRVERVGVFSDGFRLF